MHQTNTIDPITYTYKTVGDLDIQADVFIPKEPPTNHTYPVVLCIHGGGYIYSTRKDSFSPQELNEMLGRGWAVVAIDYRLAPGALLKDILEDIQDAYHWVRTKLIKDFPVDPERISVFGQSAGGGFSLISGFFLSPRPKAVISFYPFCADFTKDYFYNPDTLVEDKLVEETERLSQPISNCPTTIADFMVSDFSQSPNPRVAYSANLTNAKKYGWMLTTRNQSETKENIETMLKQFSPVYNVDETYPPTYLAHGLGDSIVNYNQSVEMSGVLEKKNIPHKLDLIPDVSHVFDFYPDPTGELWKQHVLPAFDFIQPYMQ